MARPKRIIVRGTPRLDSIDPLVLLQLLLSIGEEWDAEDRSRHSSPDRYDAAIEDHGGAAESGR